MTPIEAWSPLLIDPAGQLRTANLVMPPTTRRRDDSQPIGCATPKLGTTSPERAMTKTPAPVLPPDQRTIANHTLPPNLMLRRTAPASRPPGRSAVGLRPNLDPDAYFDAKSPRRNDRKTSSTNDLT